MATVNSSGKATFSLTGLDVGSTKFRARIVDPAGNTDLSATAITTVAPPTVSITTVPFTAGTTPQIVVTASDASPMVQVTVDVSLSGSSTFSGPHDLNETALTLNLPNNKATVINLNSFPLPDLGTYYLRAHVFDSAGNEGTSSTVTMLGPKSDTVTLSVPATVSATSEYASVTVAAGSLNSIPGTVYLDVAPNTATGTFTQYTSAVLPTSGKVTIPLLGLAAGSYKIRARIVDPAGNTDVSTTQTMTVLAPVVTIKALPFQVGQVPQVVVTASDVNAMTQVIIDVAFSGSSTFSGPNDLNETEQSVTLVNNLPTTITLNPFPEPYLSSYYVRARVLDAAGNQGISNVATMEGPQPNKVTMTLPTTISTTGTNNVIVYATPGQGNGYAPGTPVNISIDLNHDGIFEPSEVYASAPLSSFDSVTIPLTKLNQLLPGTYSIQASVVSLAGTTDVSTTQTITIASSAPAAGTPLPIIPNVGQITYSPNVADPPTVQYVVPFASNTAFLSSNELDLSMPDSTDSNTTWQTMALVNAATDATGTGQDLEASTSNFFMNGLQLTGVANYGQVTFSNVYPDVSVSYNGTSGSLQYFFTVEPGGSAGSIGLSFPGDSVSLDSAGDLVLTLPNGSTMTDSRPIAYQVGANGVQQAVLSSFVLVGNGQVGISVGTSNSSLPLIIDPYIFANFLSSAATVTSSAGITEDSQGNIYILANTASNNFAGGGGVATAAQDAVVTKLNSSGQPVYTTYLGGAGATTGTGIAVDAAGYAYLTGNTKIPAAGAAFPTTPGTLTLANFGGVAAGNVTGFVTVLNPSGNIFESSYLGGTGTEPVAIAVDGLDNIWVAGDTSNFALPAQYPVHTLTGHFTTFLTKFAPLDLTALTGYKYTDLVGGTNAGVASADTLYGLAIDNVNRIYLVGETDSTVASSVTNPWGSTAAVAAVAKQSIPYIATNAGGLKMGYVLQLQENTSAATSYAVLTYGSYIGGTTTAAAALSNIVTGIYVKTQPAPNAATVEMYLTGTTNATDNGTGSATDFYRQVTQGLNHVSAGSKTTAFVLELQITANTAGTGTTSQITGTFVGTDGGELGDNISLDSNGNIYVGGAVPAEAASAYFDTKPVQAYPGAPVFAFNAFVTEFNPTATSVLFGTLLGGNAAAETEEPAGITGGANVGGVGMIIDPAGNIFVTGLTNNFNSFKGVVTANAGTSTLYPSPGVNNNIFVTKISPTASPNLGADQLEPNDTSNAPFNVTNSIYQGTNYLGQTTYGPFPLLNTFRHSNGLYDYDWFQVVPPKAGLLTITISNITVFKAGPNNATNTAGDLDLYVYQMINGFLYLLGKSTLVNSGFQTVAVNVAAGADILWEVNPYNYTQATYTMAVTLT